MDEITKLKSTIAAADAKIATMESVKSQLQDKLTELEMIRWDPDEGDFVVNSDGGICKNSHTTPCADTRLFGTMRKTLSRAKMASRNMRKFNRLSCFMSDLMPTIEFTEFSVAMVFYDYDGNLLTRLKSILSGKAEL